MRRAFIRSYIWYNSRITDTRGYRQVHQVHQGLCETDGLSFSVSYRVCLLRLRCTFPTQPPFLTPCISPRAAILHMGCDSPISDLTTIPYPIRNSPYIHASQPPVQSSLSVPFNLQLHGRSIVSTRSHKVAALHVSLYVSSLT
jgi:hypothetical protein